MRGCVRCNISLHLIKKKKVTKVYIYIWNDITDYQLVSVEKLHTEQTLTNVRMVN